MQSAPEAGWMGNRRASRSSRAILSAISFFADGLWKLRTMRCCGDSPFAAATPGSVPPLCACARTAPFRSRLHIMIWTRRPNISVSTRSAASACMDPSHSRLLRQGARRLDEGEKKLREAARNAPPMPLTLHQMRALDRGDEVRTTSTGSDRDYGELQGEMGASERGTSWAPVQPPHKCFSALYESSPAAHWYM